MRAMLSTLLDHNISRLSGHKHTDSLNSSITNSKKLQIIVCRSYWANNNSYCSHLHRYPTKQMKIHRHLHRKVTLTLISQYLLRWKPLESNKIQSKNRLINVFDKLWGNNGRLRDRSPMRKEESIGSLFHGATIKDNVININQCRP